MSNIGKDPNDRAIGEYWEDRFCDIARDYGWKAWPFQRRKGATFQNGKGNRYICPDVWILRRGNQQFVCEIKHKAQARNNCYGFEKYRADNLLRLESTYENEFGRVVALYVVHNWAKAGGGKYEKANREKDWHAQLLTVCEATKKLGLERTLYNGKVTKEPVVIHYYRNPFKTFLPLAYFLE